MKIQKILCPIDFSEFNQAANQFASEMAFASGAEIIYLNVPDQNALRGDYGYAMERTQEQALERLKQTCKPTHAEVRYRHDVQISRLTGRTIVEFADENDVDLIALSTHGRTGLRRLLIGSVAEYVVRNANCAVMTVKPQKPCDAEHEAQPSAHSSGAERE